MGMNNRDGWPCPYFYFLFLTILCQFVDNHLEHHLGVIRATTGFLVQLPEVVKVEGIHNRADNAHGIVLRNVLVYPLRKKYRLIRRILTEML